jgi:hypothetical protein
MATYRTLGLSECVSWGAIGKAVALVRSPMAMAPFAVFGGAGSLLTMGFVTNFWEQTRRGRLRRLAAGAFVAEAASGAFIGYASLLGRRCAPARGGFLAGAPYAVTGLGSPDQDGPQGRLECAATVTRR